MDKTDRIILKRVLEGIEKEGLKKISPEDLKSRYLGELMFLAIDTWGLPEKLVKDMVNDIYNRS